MDDLEVVEVAGRSLRLPPGVEGRLLSRSDERPMVERFVANSPDATVYHQPAYLEFARQQNGAADLLLLLESGNAVLAMPVHPQARGRITTGYSGLLFGPGRSEGHFRRAIGVLGRLVTANSGRAFEAIQAGVAPSYRQPARMTTMARFIEELPTRKRALYTRMISLTSSTARGRDELPASSVLVDDLSTEYDGDLRNQIRQSIRRGVTISFSVPHDDGEREEAYRVYHPIHVESWQRTGMDPHPIEYWLSLSRGISDGGGRDLIVVARDRDARPVAAVTCHLYRGAALYWSGCSAAAAGPLRANPLCLHAAIEACRTLEIETFELGRFDVHEPSDKERSITAYKAQFGGCLHRVVSFATPPRRSEQQRTRLERALRRARRAFR